MKLSKGQLLAYGAVAVLMVGLGILVALAQQRRDLRQRADTKVTAVDGNLDCDPGVDPYNSNTISVVNNTDKAIDKLRFDVHRCPYVPGMIEQYRGSFKCEQICQPNEPNCLEGVWDGDASNQGFTLQPGESRTFSAKANNCEIVQVDVQNIGDGNNDYECHNVRSKDTVPPGELWPGGIAFGISENATGYPECKQPTPTPTSIPSSSTPAGTATPTATPQPTAPPGQPTYTPIPPTPTSYWPTPIPTTPSKGGVPVPTGTPTPTVPVSGNSQLSIMAVIGGIGLMLIAAFALRR